MDKKSPVLFERYLSMQQPVAVSLPPTQSGAAPGQEIPGEIFGVPVSMGNYYFAKRVAWMFPRPWGASDLPETERENAVWESLIFHYEAYQRGIAPSEQEVESMINAFLKDEKQPFTRGGDPEAYRRWVVEKAREEPELFENQVRFLIQIRKLRDKLLQEQKVAVSEEEMRQVFLDEQNHVGGEMVVFDTKDEAQAFYEKVKSPKAWEKMKADGRQKVRPVSLMTLEAYMDLWSIPNDQMYAFHGMKLGSVGPPMPFGKQWCVYRLLDKRVGNLEDFQKGRDAYFKKVEMKKKYEGMKQQLEELKKAAQLKVFVK